MLTGILSAPGIAAGYKWVPARIGCFSQNKIFFSKYQRPIINCKNGYSFVRRHFPCSVFPDSNVRKLRQPNLPLLEPILRHKITVIIRARSDPIS